MSSSACSPTVTISQPRRKCDPLDWDAHKGIISKLYSTNELKQVMKTMHETHGFKATTKQYKNQITKWGLDKKRIKAAEYKAMLKEKWRHEKREPTARVRFFLHGEEVPASKISRFESRMRSQKKITGNESFSNVETPPDLVVTTVLPSKLDNNINAAVVGGSNESSAALTIRTRSTLQAQLDALDQNNTIGSSCSTDFHHTHHRDGLTTACENAESGGGSSRSGVTTRDATKMTCIFRPENPGSLEWGTLNQLHFIQTPSLVACDWYTLYSEYCSIPCEATYLTQPRHQLETILRSYARKLHSYEDHLRHSNIVETFGPCDASCCYKNTIKLQPLTSSACTLHRVRNKLQKDLRDGELSLEAYHNLQAHTFFRILPQLEISHYGLVKYAMTALASTGDFQAYLVLYDFLQKFISPSSYPYRFALLDIASHLHKAGRDAQAAYFLRSALSFAYRTVLSICEASYSKCISLAQATAALTDGQVEMSYDHVGMLWYFPVGEYAYREIRAWYILEDGKLDSSELWIHGCALQIMCNMRRMLDDSNYKPKTHCPVRVATCNTLVA